ncbi:MAG: aminotransferase class III-fold pyridoxal phosphate-dependent enzyme, partial [Clostridia bacterium]|nr:aminotransferase class III-fold pyridoxal phosphate-dependent enzyme [Clostridia bacterium]
MLYNDIIENDEKYFMPVYGRRFPIAIDRGENCFLFDTEGKKYIDFTSGIATNALGYDKGYKEHLKAQVDKICHFSNLYYNEPQAILVEKLCSYFKEPYKAFICNSGAEANECAIKLVRKHFKDDGKYKILALRNSFHGRTMATLSETGQEKFHKDFKPLCPEFDFFSTIEELKEKIDAKTGAIILELIQGEGGVNPLGKSFVKNIETICKQQNLLLIIDEIQTGIGRTGAMFASEHYDLSPDIITLAKGLGGGVPIGACLAKEHISFSKGDHGTTFGGNPLCCSAANYVLDMVDEKLLNHVNE